MDVVAYLAAKGYQGKQGPGPERKYPCFFASGSKLGHGQPAGCGESADSRKRKLYVNADDGWFDCKVCGAHGGPTLLQRYFGDEEAASLPGADPGERRRILNEVTQLAHEWLWTDDDTLLYLLNERGLSVETITERRIGRVKGRRSLAGHIEADKRDLATTGLVHRDGPRAGQDFFYDHILIPYITHGQVVQVRGKVPGGKYMTGPGESVRLFNTDALDDADDVIVTEGEFDAMALAQHLGTAADDAARRIGVVGLAGTGAYPSDMEGYFVNARRVFLGLDPDDAGRRAAVRLKERLGSKARILELPPELPKCDWTEFLLPVPEHADNAWRAQHPHAGHAWQDVLALMGEASGKRLFSIVEAGRKWRTQRSSSGGIQTGWRQLDSAILPGMLPGQLAVVLAKTGTGKTIVLCNLAYHQRDLPMLFISLEQTQEEVYERLRRIYLHHHPLASDEDVEAAYSKLMICEENRLGKDDLAQLIEEYEIETGEPPAVVLLDYLGYYARGMNGRSPYEKVSEAVMQLKGEAKRHRVVLWAPHQVNRMAKEGKPIGIDDARDSGVVEETADFMFSIYRPDDALREDSTSEPSGRLQLDINKSRHGGKGRRVTLLLDLLTLAIVETLSPEAKRVEQHNYLHWRGQTYEELRREETAPRQTSMSVA